MAEGRLLARRSLGPKVPEALEAEAAVLGACLLDQSAVGVVGHELAPEDFYSPGNAAICDAVLTLWRAGSAVDTVTVSALLAERNLLDMAGGPATLVTYLAECPSTRSVGSYAALVAERATRRRLLGLASGWTTAAYDMAVPVDETVSDAVKELRALDLPSRPEGPDRLQDLLDREDSMTYDWVVDGLLESTDRMMLTAGEGQGKSLLLAQMAVQLSAGIHPFRRAKIDPVRVLVVDVENPPNLVARRFSNLLDRLPKHSAPRLGDGDDQGFDIDRLRVRVRTEGLDLLSRNDRKWFLERVVANEPQVLVTGPVYKMHRGEATEEGPAREVAAFFDDLRGTYRCCLLLEAHSPYGTDGGRHRTLRPFGASLWSRWPEFGFGMRLSDEQPTDSLGRPRPDQQVVDWVAWRGSREDGRGWPRRLRRGGWWPWENAALAEEKF